MVLKWYAGCFFSKEFREGENIYRLIDREAEEAAAGSEGLVMLPHLSGASNRNITLWREGYFIGMTLGHERGSIFKGNPGSGGLHAAAEYRTD